MKAYIKDYFFLTLGALIYAFAIEGFLVPNQMIDGGVIGISMIISHVTKINLGILVVLINAILGVFQENKAEKSLEALKKMSSPNCKVIRDGKITVVASEDITVGDLLVLEAGDIVPSDCRIIDCNNLTVDEASLTGESVPVEKNNKVINQSLNI